MQTPPDSLTKSVKHNSTRRSENLSYVQSTTLAKMVEDALGNEETNNSGFASPLRANTSPLFERVRFHEAYSARRNKRLKWKKGQSGDEGKTVYNLGVTVESSKRSSSRKLESLRTSETPRYSAKHVQRE